MWKTAPPPVPSPTPHSEFRRHPIGLSVRQAIDSPDQWSFFELALGMSSSKTHAECLKTWPREALALARQALDEFEQYLKEQDL